MSFSVSIDVTHIPVGETTPVENRHVVDEEAALDAITHHIFHTPNLVRVDYGDPSHNVTIVYSKEMRSMPLSAYIQWLKGVCGTN